MDYKRTFARISMLGAAAFALGVLGWLGSWALYDKPPWGIYMSLLALITGITQAPFVIAILLRTAGALWGARLFRLTALVALSWLPIGGTMVIILLVAKSSLIPWAPHPSDHFWYNPVFFAARLIIFFTLFYGLTFKMFKTSQLKGTHGAAIGNHRLMLLGLATAVTFVLGATVFSWDTGMTLNHHYGDTIYGVYYIITSFFGGVALTVLLMSFINKSVGKEFFTSLHFRNLGSLTLALTILSFYAWWSQFFPIWYANIPEETNAIYLRIFSRWGLAYGTMMAMVSVIPFISLMFKRVRTTSRGLSYLAFSILGGLWTLQYLYSAPPLIENGLAAPLSVFSLPNLSLTAGLVGGFLFLLFRNLQKNENAFLAPPADSEINAELEGDYLITQPEGW